MVYIRRKKPMHIKPSKMGYTVTLSSYHNFTIPISMSCYLYTASQSTCPTISMPCLFPPIKLSRLRLIPKQLFQFCLCNHFFLLFFFTLAPDRRAVSNDAATACFCG